MHVARVVIGGIIVAVGLALIVGHGTLLGINAGSIAGSACPMVNGTSFCPYTGTAVGLVVLLFGLPFLIQGLVAPSQASIARSMGLPGMGAMLPPGMAPPSSGSETPGGPARFCPACGTRNAANAAFCNKCGKPMPPPTG